MPSSSTKLKPTKPGLLAHFILPAKIAVLAAILIVSASSHPDFILTKTKKTVSKPTKQPPITKIAALSTSIKAKPIDDFFSPGPSFLPNQLAPDPAIYVPGSVGSVFPTPEPSTDLNNPIITPAPPTNNTTAPAPDVTTPAPAPSQPTPAPPPGLYLPQGPTANPNPSVPVGPNLNAPTPPPAAPQKQATRPKIPKASTKNTHPKATSNLSAPKIPAPVAQQASLDFAGPALAAWLPDTQSSVYYRYSPLSSLMTKILEVAAAVLALFGILLILPARKFSIALDSQQKQKLSFVNN